MNARMKLATARNRRRLLLLNNVLIHITTLLWTHVYTLTLYFGSFSIVISHLSIEPNSQKKHFVNSVEKHKAFCFARFVLSSILFRRTFYFLLPLVPCHPLSLTLALSLYFSSTSPSIILALFQLWEFDIQCLSDCSFHFH